MRVRPRTCSRAISSGWPARVRVGLVLLGALVLASGCGGSQAAPLTTATAKPLPKVLRIVFPEGFTRAQMADRVGAVSDDRAHKRVA